ncbi:hypothetical protein NC652_009938 [Populus alba x Populus x berolinensis]|nr:hypothetical protein NC652_009938 [Populus alba x Populus x berolinensis]
MEENRRRGLSSEGKRTEEKRIQWENGGQSTALLMFIFRIYLYWEFWHKTHEMIPNDKGFWVEFAVKADLSDDPWKLDLRNLSRKGGSIDKQLDSHHN